MPIRNPFARRTDVHTGVVQAENDPNQNGSKPTFEKVDTMGSKSSAMSINSGTSEPAEYKMSVVNDSGVYLPPSPPAEKKGLWPRRSNVSNTSYGTRNSEDIEAFSISRESFDSYRRSFDISAKSPVIPADLGRQSLDSARVARLPLSAIGERRFERQPPTAEEGFEDVGLNDDHAKQAKKKGFFSKFGDATDGNATPTTASRFHIGGRKRGQSGVGEELGNLPRPGTANSKEVKITEVH